MIHSASFLATGSEIDASTWVASSGLCLRIRSMTFSRESISSFDVDELAAIAAGATGLRAGVGLATRWRTAGAGAAIAGGSEVIVLSLAGAVAGEGGVVFGTVL